MKTYKVSYTIEVTVGDEYPDVGERVEAGETNEDTMRSIAEAYSNHVHDLFMQNESFDAESLTVVEVDSTAERNDLYDRLRRHPLTTALIAWVAEDAGDFDPDSVNWGAVEDRCTENGHEVIHLTGSPMQRDCTHCGEPTSRYISTEAGEVYECEDCAGN